ncbi:MAG: IS1634 family transposase, partial [Sphaerochaeta sp.]
SLLSAIPFVSRLPRNFSACGQAVDRAVNSGQWTHIGRLAELESTCVAAEYKSHETSVDIEGRSWRALVVHSNAQDKRRQKSIAYEQEQSLKKITAMTKPVQKRYFCEKDARAAAQAMSQMETPLHTVKASYRETVVNKRGRPPKEGPRPTNTYYDLVWEVLIREDRLQLLREQAGCFVLLSNVPSCGENSLDAKALLRTYKGQYGVESDFVFLKDPLVVNDLFLKTPSRIDALGMILVVALLIWRLMERQMRMYLAHEGKRLPGWDNKPTDRPTSFMMSTVFYGIQVARPRRGEPVLLKALSDRQMQFLEALGLDERVFLDNGVKCILQCRRKPGG